VSVYPPDIGAGDPGEPGQLGPSGAGAADFRDVLAAHGGAHWWHAGMRKATWALLGEAHGRVLDVGCGPGWELMELPPTTMGVGVDLAIRRAIPRPLAAADAGRLPFADGVFDGALALDLLEQREVQPAPVLAEIRRVLRPGGRLLARVPAHPWLHGPHDAFWGGARRYRRAEFAALVIDAGFAIRRLTYANGLLFAPAVVGRLLARIGCRGEDDLRPLPTLINRALLGILALEAHWLRRRDLPMGLSLICLAERERDA
jgi:SAM-dependent methyltransferase